MSGRTATVELTIDALAAGGDGVGRAPDGRVVFVPFTAPGDRVEVALEPGGARFARGRVITLREPGAARTDPVCAVYGSCGGCAWQHVAYPTQVAAKEKILADALARIGGFALLDPPRVIPCPAPYGYRGRTRVVVSRGRVGYRRRRSHGLCATSRCPVLVPQLDAALGTLAANPPRIDGEWELGAGSDGTVRVASVANPDPSLPRLAVGAGADVIERSPGVFAQSNTLLLDALVEAVLDAAGEGDFALELFAGAGFFTLGLARRFRRVLAVEGDPAAAADLAHNAARSRLGNVEILSHAVERAFAAARANPESSKSAPDVVVLDPPRTGLPRGVAEQVVELAPDRIVYLSCDPATLARDLSAMCDEDYVLVRAQGFDLFPQTAHVEALAVLVRRPGSGDARSLRYGDTSPCRSA